MRGTVAGAARARIVLTSFNQEVLGQSLPFERNFVEHCLSMLNRHDCGAIPKEVSSSAIVCDLRSLSNTGLNAAGDCS